MKALIASVFLTALWLTNLVRAADDGVVTFSGRSYRLAFVQVAKDGSVVNEYVPTSETLDNWTTLLAMRYYPGAKKIGEPASEWVQMVHPLLTRNIEPIGKKEEPNVLLLDAWLSAPDKSYIEVDYYLFRQEESAPGVKAYQFAQKIVMAPAGKGDVTAVVKKKASDYDEIWKLRLPVLKEKRG
jgi:hypothetical protein